PRRMTNGSRDSSPRWSPNGKMLAFVRSPEQPATPAAAGGAAPQRPEGAQLYMLNLAGGESWRITDLPRGAGAAFWSPDSKTIAFTSTTSPDDLAKQRKGRTEPKKPESAQEKPSAEQGAPEKPAEAKSSAEAETEHESDVRVITRAVYRFND